MVPEVGGPPGPECGGGAHGACPGQWSPGMLGLEAGSRRPGYSSWGPHAALHGGALILDPDLSGWLSLCGQWPGCFCSLPSGRRPGPGLVGGRSALCSLPARRPGSQDTPLLCGIFACKWGGLGRAGPEPSPMVASLWTPRHHLVLAFLQGPPAALTSTPTVEKLRILIYWFREKHLK